MCRFAPLWRELRSFPMKIVAVGSVPTKTAPESYFTGRVLQTPLNEAPAPARLRALVVSFEPGARTAWRSGVPAVPPPGPSAATIADETRRTRPRRLAAGGTVTDHTRRRMWFLDQLDPGNPSHHVTLITTPAAVRVPDTLLVRFDDDGRPVPGGPPVVVRSAQVPDVRAAVRAELTQPFDLREGPLVRALELNSSLLVLTMHGILGDIRVLETVLGGPTPPAAQGSPGFWLDHLRDLPVLELPADRPRPPLHRPEAGVVPWSADVDSDALLAALQVVLGQHIGF